MTDAIRDRAASRNFTREQAETECQVILGVSYQDACAMLARGELEGTFAGGAVQSYRWMLGDDG